MLALKNSLFISGNVFKEIPLDILPHSTVLRTVSKPSKSMGQPIFLTLSGAQSVLGLVGSILGKP